MPQIISSIACNLDAGILLASFPLLEEGRVEGIEWSFDTLFGAKNEMPVWFDELLRAYSNEHRLIGHGVFFSLFSGRWSAAQEQWLRHLRHVSGIYTFDHITEHFGFMTGSDFHSGAPLNIPYTQTTLNIGRSRLARIYDACHCPVGLENLAFAYTADEVKRHGAFLEQLLEPVNGFIILDLHNLYCQMHNFGIGEMMAMYPLHMVREIHISGGSWQQEQQAPAGKVRRDTHDDAVPQEVFRLLEQAIHLCPNVKYVVMEQLGTGLSTPESRAQYYTDFIRMQEIVKRLENDTERSNGFLPLKPVTIKQLEDETLHLQQVALSDILESSASLAEVQQRLLSSPLAGTDWRIEDWQPYMLETARQIAYKWKA